MSKVDEEKTAVRGSMLARLKAQDAPARQMSSLAVAEQVIASPAYRRAQVLLTYVALPYEVQTQAIIAAARAEGKRVAVPAVQPGRAQLLMCEWRDGEALVRGPFGVRQPADVAACLLEAGAVDCALVPGIAFDRERYRLGHGGGYFDRLLAELNAAVPRLGLGFAFQLVDRLPRAAHDQPVTQVITDERRASGTGRTA